MDRTFRSGLLEASVPPLRQSGVRRGVHVCTIHRYSDANALTRSVILSMHSVQAAAGPESPQHWPTLKGICGPRIRSRAG